MQYSTHLNKCQYVAIQHLSAYKQLLKPCPIYLRLFLFLYFDLLVNVYLFLKKIQIF